MAVDSCKCVKHFASFLFSRGVRCVSRRGRSCFQRLSIVLSVLACLLLLEMVLVTAQTPVAAVKQALA